MLEEVTLIFFLVSHLFISGVTSRNFTIENKCDFTVWPGIFTNYGTQLSTTTGFVLKKGETHVINVPLSWSGGFWGRSFCSTNSTGNFSCATGDCGSGKIECSRAGAPPRTLAEFTLDSDNEDFYDVSLVDGYNLPLVVVPEHPQSGQTCRTVGCAFNLNSACPFPLEVRGSSGEEQPIACMSPCQAFSTARYCCRDEYARPDRCLPTPLTQYFKKDCPTAYSYALDEKTNTVRCSNSPNYIITFCSLITPNSTK